MPLPTDEKILALSQQLIQGFDTVFGLHPGFRPAHAKGVLVEGTFSPSRDAAWLTRAPHIARPSTPVTVRFSDSTGLPNIPDSDPNAAPSGLAIRFNLAEHVHTDIVSHSMDGFPTRTGQEFLEFLQAVAASAAAKESPTPVEQFLGTHPAALRYVQAPKPTPASFATQTYFGVTAMKFVNAAGAERFGRYRIMPDAGIQVLEQAALASKPGNFLFEELSERLGTGPVGFELMVQVAEAGDVTDDATVHWPESRRLLSLGKLSLTKTAVDDGSESRKIIFDPIPRVDGIDPSDDPLLELRAAIYLMSGRRRRAAGAGTAAGG